MCVVSSFVAPVVKFLSLPVIIVTIGLFLLVVNALMLMLTGWIAGELEIGFEVAGFWNALFGSIIISSVGSLVGAVLDDDRWLPPLRTDAKPATHSAPLADIRRPTRPHQD